jgi:serine/threonine protein kinase
MVIGGKFALTRLLDERARSTVFEARHVALGRRLAIEILDPELGADAEAVASLQRAAAAASSIEHPNIVAMFDVARDPLTNARFVARRFLQGRRLRALMTERGRMGIAEALDLLVPIMGALEAVHRLHVFHGGVRPESIFLESPEGGEGRAPGGAEARPIVPMLVDFGLAQVDLGADAHEALRAMGYVTPEQARGEKIDARTDVWAIGAVLFEMLAGRGPFVAATAEELRARIASEAPTRLESLVEVASGTRALIARALEPDRARRFASMGEMLRAALACSVDGSGLGAELAARHRASLGDMIEKAHAIWSAPRTTPFELVTLSGSGPASGEAPLSIADLGRMRAMTEEPRTHEHAPEVAEQHAAAATIAAAHAALQLNALEEAFARAGVGLATAVPSGDAVAIAELRLVQATARAWQGLWTEAAPLARDAMSGHALFGVRWMSALGLCAEAAGSLGRVDELAGLSEALIAAPPEAKRDPSYVVAECRLAIRLLHAGQIQAAERWLADARGYAAQPNTIPLVHAWIEAARAEAAAHDGDLGAARSHALASAARFEEAGDARDACRMRAMVGHALVELGAFEEAAGVLREDLACAEAMGLYFVSTLHVDLGRARLRLGEDDALETLTHAIAQAQAQGDHWDEAFARGYLARALVERDPAAAEREARRAVEASDAAPSSRAFALAVLAELAVRRPGGAPEALAYASEAYQMLAKLRGVESGQLYIRLQFAAALEASGRGIQARAVIEAARDRLVAMANRITDARRRASFLEDVPENAAVRAWLRRLSGSQAPPLG